VARICSLFFPICSALLRRYVASADVYGPLYPCKLDFIKKICYNIKKNLNFPKVKRSASNYHKMELQLNTVPPKVSSQRPYVPKEHNHAARRLSVAQTGVKKWRFDFFKKLCYNRIDTLKIFRAGTADREHYVHMLSSLTILFADFLNSWAFGWLSLMKGPKVGL
jgi:hypothetical protein